MFIIDKEHPHCIAQLPDNLTTFNNFSRLDFGFTVLNNLVSTAKLFSLLSIPSYKILIAISCAGEAVS